MTKVFNLQINDAVKGVIVAVFAAVVMFLYSLVQTPGFAFSAIDWHELLRVAFASGIGYIAKQFISSSRGTTEEKIAGVSLAQPPTQE